MSINYKGVNLRSNIDYSDLKEEIKSLSGTFEASIRSQIYIALINNEKDGIKNLISSNSDSFFEVLYSIYRYYNFNFNDKNREDLLKERHKLLDESILYYHKFCLDTYLNAINNGEIKYADIKLGFFIENILDDKDLFNFILKNYFVYVMDILFKLYESLNENNYRRRADMLLRQIEDILIEIEGKIGTDNKYESELFEKDSDMLMNIDVSYLRYFMEKVRSNLIS